MRAPRGGKIATCGHPARTGPIRRPSCVLLAGLAALAAGCDTPHTSVVFENRYPASTPLPVIARAVWEAASLPAPLVPGGSSGPLESVPASANTAYALLAPGWDPPSGSPPSLIALRSRQGFSLHLDRTLLIPIDDERFAGDCAAASPLSQDEADFITQRVFASDFAGRGYDAQSCTSFEVP